MRIGIDARTILNPEKGDAIGVGHYSYQLIRNLLSIDTENQYVLFFDFKVREKDVKKFSQPNVKIKFFPFSDYKKYLPGAYNEILGRAAIAGENLDVLHSTSAQNRIPASYMGKTIVTFHDLSLYTNPESFPMIKRTRDRAVFSLMASKADRIIAVSNSTRNDVEKYLNVPSEKIDVIYSGLDKRFFDKAYGNGVAMRERLGIEKKYILFLGTMEPIKNITRLLEAFAVFKRRVTESHGSFEYQLVLAGKRGWLSQEYPQMVKDFDLQKDVVFTGYIVGDELVPLFRGAEIFAMPSLYEGFGTTVLEAFATETPTILSRVSSLPEIAGDASYFVNPINVPEIAEALWKMSQDEALRNDYRKKGLVRAEKFDWVKCARETLEVYKKVAGSK